VEADNTTKLCVSGLNPAAYSSTRCRIVAHGWRKYLVDDRRRCDFPKDVETIRKLASCTTHVIEICLAYSPIKIRNLDLQIDNNIRAAW
jgi:hypothetical protein